MPDHTLSPVILPVVMEVLTKKYPMVAFDADTPFMDGIGGDSFGLSEVIVEIENATGREWNPDTYGDLDAPITPMRLAQAFKAL